MKVAILANSNEPIVSDRYRFKIHGAVICPRCRKELIYLPDRITAKGRKASTFCHGTSAETECLPRKK